MSNYHLIVFGASSFVGKLLTRYLFEQYGVHGDLRWAIAGRSEQKLQSVRAGLGATAQTLSIVLANSDDSESLLALCKQTRCVVSTVGPYAYYGSNLVKVCAESGTDYCDLTGEPHWITNMIKQHEATAKQSGARIVHCCGFDSIPSDMGTYYLQQQALAHLGQYCSQVKMRVKSIRGGLSGGTVESMINIITVATQDPATMQVVKDPYALCPKTDTKRPQQPNLRFSNYDAAAKAWSFPFVMAAINTKVVHRSHALTGYAYGANFTYDEAVLTGRGIIGGAIATGAAIGFITALGAMVVPPSRKFLSRFVVPKSGEGPSPRQQKKGYYDLRFYGSTLSGQTLTTQVTGDRDPGYGSTAKMLGEAAVCLALDIPQQQQEGGFWTPSSLMGDTLINRLSSKNAGLTFKVLS